jgi:hypothetical protein
MYGVVNGVVVGESVFGKAGLSIGLKGVLFRGMGRFGIGWLL